MTPVTFTLSAETELLEAEQRYESEKPGLGARFKNAVEKLINRISQSPQQFPKIEKNVHRAIVIDFPYALLFHEKNDEILIFACFHSSRDPMNWRRRIQ